MVDSEKIAFFEKIQSVTSLSDLENLRVVFLGKKSSLSLALRELGKIQDLQQRRERSQLLNGLSEYFQETLDMKRAELEALALTKKLQTEILDVTLPSAYYSGCLHPLSVASRDILRILGKLGFVFKEGPNIEDDFHNFSALNIPADHPARCMHDTFYLCDGKGDPSSDRLLRTHTSSVQIRTLLKEGAPICMASLGRTYRSDSDATHTPMFHQIEGLLLDKNVHMGHLKWCIQSFMREFFGDSGIQIRLRPSFFPFTEPSAEVDLSYDGKKWLEVAGCGMVHPHVLSACEIDSSVYGGFAFGMGLERLTMLKYGIQDLRRFFEGNLRWLHHYAFAPFYGGVF